MQTSEQSDSSPHPRLQTSEQSDTSPHPRPIVRVHRRRHTRTHVNVDEHDYSFSILPTYARKYHIHTHTSQKTWVTRGPGMHAYMPSLPPNACRLASTRAYKQTVSTLRVRRRATREPRTCEKCCSICKRQRVWGLCACASMLGFVRKKRGDQKIDRYTFMYWRIAGEVAGQVE